jgi:hypothetical protein
MKVFRSQSGWSVYKQFKLARISLFRSLRLYLMSKRKPLLDVNGFQGDQMSLRKIRPKCSPTNYLPKLMHNFSVEKCSLKIRATSVIFKKLPKVNNRPHRRKFAQSGHPDGVNYLYRTGSWIPQLSRRCPRDHKLHRGHWPQLLRLGVSQGSFATQTQFGSNLLIFRPLFVQNIF